MIDMWSWICWLHLGTWEPKRHWIKLEFWKCQARMITTSGVCLCGGVMTPFLGISKHSFFSFFFKWWKEQNHGIYRVLSQLCGNQERSLFGIWVNLAASSPTIHVCWQLFEMNVGEDTMTLWAIVSRLCSLPKSYSSEECMHSLLIQKPFVDVLWMLISVPGSRYTVMDPMDMTPALDIQPSQKRLCRVTKGKPSVLLWYHISSREQMDF